MKIGSVLVRSSDRKVFEVVDMGGFNTGFDPSTSTLISAGSSYTLQAPDGERVSTNDFEVEGLFEPLGPNVEVSYVISGVPVIVSSSASGLTTACLYRSMQPREKLTASFRNRQLAGCSVGGGEITKRIEYVSQEEHTLFQAALEKHEVFLRRAER